ncbi:outer membrane protein assembly factor BamB [Accumulibacter sp.]|uniref:outer membrane protein assembly factor BamB n=1 Tax=Accumulibacter sp. TaxID=2053492 RepID=UPI0026128670|nr:outer membrane protein assembly factor BamB [Accumulibacter sp.]
MRRPVLALLLPLVLAGCSMLDSLNPFSSSGPKMAELQPIQASAQARVVWQESVGKGEPYAFVPAVVGSSVYAAGRDGTIARFDDGRPVWRIKTEQPLSGGVGADERLLAVGTAKGDILAFAAADGKLLWEAKASSEVLAPPAVAGGRVIVRSGDHRLAAYDAADGTRKWIYQRPTPALSVRVTAGPVVVEKYVFAGFPGGKLIAVNADNGAPLWEGTVALPKGATELDRIADVSSVPVIDARMICAVAFQGRVSCFDLGAGNLIWARDISSAAGLSIDSRYVYVADDQGAVHALDKASGASIWKQDKLFLRRLTAPLASGGLVAVADVQGVVHLLSRDDGSFAARLSTDGKPVVAPLQRIGKNLLVQTSGGGLYAIEAQ